MQKNMNHFSKRPLKLKSTRVWRTYSGGKLIDELLQRENPMDSQFPEDWIASLVIANNPGREHLQEGLSGLEWDDNRQYTLKEVIDSDPEAFLGERHVKSFGNNTGVLAKILDSAERLTIQVHPDQNDALKFFGSRFGKTEAWYILGGREMNGEPPYVLFGFKPGITRELWKEIFMEQDIPRMLDALHKFYVKPGDLFFIDGGVPHAIGPGCFLIEIQEPTDYTLRTERKTPRGLEVPDQLCHQGIGFEEMLDCFHYEGLQREDILIRWSLQKVTLLEKDEGKIDSLVSYCRTSKFAMNILEVKSEMELQHVDCFSIILVIAGHGYLRSGDENIAVNRGEQIFLPYSAGKVFCINDDEEPLKLIQFLPPIS